jgi:hypothetical protein
MATTTKIANIVATPIWSPSVTPAPAGGKNCDHRHEAEVALSALSGMPWILRRELGQEIYPISRAVEAGSFILTPIFPDGVTWLQRHGRGN